MKDSSPWPTRQYIYLCVVNKDLEIKGNFGERFNESVLLLYKALRKMIHWYVSLISGGNIVTD
jgi:hypothetical protein